MTKRTINFVTVSLPLAMMAVALLASPTVGQGQQAEVEAARKKIEMLLKQAKQLEDEGAADKAKLLIKQAEVLRARLAKFADQQPRKKAGGERAEILKGLKAGAASLRALGRGEEAAKLEGLAKELQAKNAVGEKNRRGGGEREVALKQIAIMRLAMQGLLEADREDAAESLEHAIHAQELALEGRRDDEAIKIRKSAPNAGQRIELLMFAAKQLRDAGKKEQASAVANLGEQLLKRYRAGQKRDGEGERRKTDGEGNKERDVAAAQLEVMQVALVALREGEREDSAELLKRAINARLVRLKRLKGEEAKVVLQREPKLEQTVEVLGLAAQLWREFNNEEKAAAVGELAEKLRSRESSKKQQPAKGAGRERLKQLEEEVVKLKAVLDKRLDELQELKTKLDR